MFKLVVVGGQLRGKEFILEDGENTIGRSTECTTVLNIPGVSKRHLSITVNNDQAFLEDLGSSNGTFLNGNMTKKSSIKDGDKIALPNVILQLVYVLEKKVIVKKRVLRSGGEDGDSYDDLDQVEPMPKDLLGKPIWLFKHKFMPIVYSFNEQYEWAGLVGILLFVFIGINISLTILPVLRDSQILLHKEIALRGRQYAGEVDRFNNIHLREKNLDQVYTGFLDGESSEGVKSYRLFDVEGRVYRPISELNTIVNDSFSVDAIKNYRNEKEQDRDFIRDLGNNTIGIARAIKAHDKNLGRDVVVAIITIYFSPTSLAREASNNSKAYLESLMTSAMVAIIFFGIFYYMTVKPIEDMRLGIEKVLRGRQKEIETRILFKELNPLRNTINSILTRIKDLQNDGSDQMEAAEDDGPYIRTLHELLLGSQGPVLILNSAKAIQHLNSEAEDLLGIRENASAGEDILSTARDRGLAATITDLCDQSANNDGTNQKASYEIGGKEMEISATAIIGKDKFAKGFFITFLRNR